MSMNESQASKAERLFSGLIGAEYDMLKLICPDAPRISQQVGAFLADWKPGRPLRVFEIGCGSGITTLALLLAREDAEIQAVDNEPVMLDQARVHLAEWVDRGRLKLVEADALSGLKAEADASVDVVASGYAMHNFLEGYRREALKEIFRVLKPGGVFVNGDRYALDDTLEHTRLTQAEARHWFKTFAALNRYDLLENWIVHLFSDESHDHIMRLGPAVEYMTQLGFEAVQPVYRHGVNTLLVAVKPESSR